MEPREFWNKLVQEFRDLLCEHADRDLSATVSEWGWVINEGDTDRFRYVFESLANQAVRGGDLIVADEGPVDAWLNRLRQGPHFTKVEGGMAVVDGVTRRSTEGGYINCLCLASVDCCVNLRKDAPGQRSVEVSASPKPAAEPSPPDVDTDGAKPTGGVGGKSENVFRRTDEGWTIAYDGQTWSGKSRLQGLSLIQTLLGSPSTLFSSAALIGRELVEISEDLVAPDGRSSLLRDETVHHSRTVSDVPPEVSARPVSSADRKAGRLIVDAKATREARKRRDEIKKDLDLGMIPEQDIPKLKEEYLALCEYLKTGPAGQVRKDNPDQEKARRTAQNQYSRALKLLTKNGLDKLQEHLKKSIKGGESYTYQPTSDVDWLT